MKKLISILAGMGWILVAFRLFFAYQNSELALLHWTEILVAVASCLYIGIQFLNVKF
jgi:hypothetical protein